MYYQDQDAEKEIKRRLSEGRVIISEHAKNRMYQRRVSRSDITKCLRNGGVVSSSFDEGYQEWTYKQTYNITGDEEVSVVVALPDNCDDDIVVTVY